MLLGRQFRGNCSRLSAELDIATHHRDTALEFYTKQATTSRANHGLSLRISPAQLTGHTLAAIDEGMDLLAKRQDLPFEDLASWCR